MTEAVIESGFAKVGPGEWLCGLAQPTAFRGTASVSGLRGFIVPDRAAVRRLVSSAEAWFGSAEAPFLTRLDALPDTSLNLVSAKLLVAPFAARVGALSLKLVPFSFLRATPVTELRMGWAVAATRSRVTRLALGDGETLSVRPEALVAWTGARPTGFCPKLGLLDLVLPRGPKNLVYSLHGPAVVWFEGSARATGPLRGARSAWGRCA